MMKTRRPMILSALLLTILGTGWAAAQTPPHYNYDPRNPYVPPSSKPVMLKTAKDYWREKREALRDGRKEPTSAAMPLPAGPAKPTVFPGVPTTELPPPPTVPPTPPPVATPSATTTAPPTEDHAPPPQATTDPAVEARNKTRREAASYSSFLHRSLAAILHETEGAPWADEGASPEAGFSPVGLVHYTFARLGYQAPPGDIEALWQSFGLNLGTAWGSFAPGDILFFRLYSKSEQTGKLFVAIVLDADTMAYPSFTRRKVVLRTYHDAFWRERFVGARRVFVD